MIKVSMIKLVLRNNRSAMCSSSTRAGTTFFIDLKSTADCLHSTDSPGEESDPKRFDKKSFW